MLQDLTEAFKEAVFKIAEKDGFDKGRLAKLRVSFLLPPVKQATPFSNSAKEVAKSIEAMRAFIIRYRRDYLDPNRMSEKERDDVEQEMGLLVKACRQQIEVLKDSISADSPPNVAAAWLGAAKSNSNLVAHRHGVVLILSQRLASVTTLFDRLRAVRFQEALERRGPKVRPGLPKRPKLSQAVDRPSSSDATSPWRDTSGPGPGSEAGSEAGATRGGLEGAGRLQVQALDGETLALQRELANLADSAAEVEGKVLEVSALSHLFSTQVLHQAHQIEVLYQQAVEATKNIDLGNKELKKTVERNSDSRVMIILFLLVASFGVLFLDWYS